MFQPSSFIMLWLAVFLVLDGILNIFMCGFFILGSLWHLVFSMPYLFCIIVFIIASFMFLQKIPRNRGSHEHLTELNKRFTSNQKAAAADMGMLPLMNIVSKNLHNPVCDWLARKYDPETKSFVIPGGGQIPLDEEYVYNTLGVPLGLRDVPYKVDPKIEDRLSSEMFPGMAKMPHTTALGELVRQMKTCDVPFKRKLLMFLVSSVFAPTTATNASNRCFPILVWIFIVLCCSYRLLVFF